MNESDWKKFRAMVPGLRERYIAHRNREILALLTNPKHDETDRFWEAMKAMEQEARVLRRCLDGHSRSKMGGAIFSMIMSAC